MTEQRHTDGPWVFEDYSQEEPEFFVVPATYYGTVAKVYREDDARLIAAAPELLEALHKVRAFIASEYRDPGAEPEGEWLDKDARAPYAIICDAISKAEDGQ